jgi:hypothetical protein
LIWLNLVPRRSASRKQRETLTSSRWTSRIGDRLNDETAEWEVIAPPYTTAGGRIVHTRVQKIDQPASWEIRNWDAFKRISVERMTTEEGKR